MSVNSSALVKGLNADMVDGVGLTPAGTLPAKVIPPTTAGYAIYYDCPVWGTGSCPLLPVDGSELKATLPHLPPGSYALVGKVNLEDETPKTGILAGEVVRCRVDAGGDYDTTEETVGFDTGEQGASTFGLEVVHTFTSSDSATIGCELPGATPGDPSPTSKAIIINLKLIAIKLDSLQNTGVTPN